MTNKKIIKLDIDGVLRDSHSEMLRIYNSTFGTNLEMKDIKEYDVNKSFPLWKERQGLDAAKQFFDVYGSKVIGLAPAYPGVSDATYKLHDLGYNIIITSYQPTDRAKIDTLLWLSRHNIYYDSVVFTNSMTKKDIPCDFIIDDCLKYLNEEPKEKRICIKQPYNEDSETPRMESLAHFVKSLECL